MDKPGIAPRGGDFAGELEEHLFEQFGFKNSLRFGETAQTHGLGADVLLHSLEMTRRAKATHGIDHRIEQAEEKETEVVRFQQFTFWAAGLFRDFASLGLRFSETGAEIVEKLPTGKLFLIDLVLRSGHE